MVEKIIRSRSWRDIGFNIRRLSLDIKKTWFLILLVGVIFQLIAFFVGKYMISGYLEHVISRLPLNINVIIPTVINIVIGTFSEELIFRCFIQQRLTELMGVAMAIIITSIIFASMHFSKGPIQL